MKLNQYKRFTSILLMLLLIGVWGYCSKYEDETYEMSALDKKADQILNDTLMVYDTVSMVSLAVLDDSTNKLYWQDSTANDKIFINLVDDSNDVTVPVTVTALMDTLMQRSGLEKAPFKCIYAQNDTALAVSGYKTKDHGYLVLTVDQDNFKPVFFSDSTFDFEVYSSSGDNVKADNVTVPMEVVAFSPKMKSRFEYTLAKGNYLLKFITEKKKFKFYSVSR
ncbi:MAG: hypothetical protein KBA26_12760 [Candidatus Delongbacteria bacterium]|nr:hypothetical protein [Candidatus Delongbacteria bacterium]